jgi:hypothetical protein
MEGCAISQTTISPTVPSPAASEMTNFPASSIQLLMLFCPVQKLGFVEPCASNADLVMLVRSPSVGKGLPQCIVLGNTLDRITVCINLEDTKSSWLTLDRHATRHATWTAFFGKHVLRPSEDDLRNDREVIAGRAFFAENWPYLPLNSCIGALWLRDRQRGCEAIGGEDNRRQPLS